MAKLLIEIPDGYIKVIMANQRMEGSAMDKLLRQAVIDGVPLQKGHGKIIDANFALEAKITKDNNGVSERTKGWNEACQAIYENAPTIIAADSESEVMK